MYRSVTTYTHWLHVYGVNSLELGPIEFYLAMIHEPTGYAHFALRVYISLKTNSETCNHPHWRFKTAIIQHWNKRCVKIHYRIIVSSHLLFILLCPYLYDGPGWLLHPNAIANSVASCPWCYHKPLGKKTCIIHWLAVNLGLLIFNYCSTVLCAEVCLVILFHSSSH